jgi:hypothetical protein
MPDAPKIADLSDANAADANLTEAELNAVTGGWPNAATLSNLVVRPTVKPKEKTIDFTNPEFEA